MDEQEKKCLVEVAIIAGGWKQSKRYNNVEAAVGVFWGGLSRFMKFFRKLDLEHVIELACGHGRYARQIKDRVGIVILMDYNQENIDFC